MQQSTNIYCQTSKHFMLSYKTLSLIATLGIMLISCDPCRNLDCLSNKDAGQFRIVSANSGNDLVFGPNKIYDKNQFKFYSLKDADTTFFDYQAIKSEGIGYDSILQIHFSPITDTAFMRLSDGDIDTLQITYKTFDTKCCGIITEITRFRFNISADIPGSQGTQELRK